MKGFRDYDPGEAEQVYTTRRRRKEYLDDLEAELRAAQPSGYDAHPSEEISVIGRGGESSRTERSTTRRAGVSRAPVYNMYEEPTEAPAYEPPQRGRTTARYEEPPEAPVYEPPQRTRPMPRFEEPPEAPVYEASQRGRTTARYEEPPEAPAYEQPQRTRPMPRFEEPPKAPVYEASQWSRSTARYEEAPKAPAYETSQWSRSTARYEDATESSAYDALKRGRSTARYEEPPATPVYEAPQRTRPLPRYEEPPEALVYEAPQRTRTMPRFEEPTEASVYEAMQRSSSTTSWEAPRQDRQASGGWGAYDEPTAEQPDYGYGSAEQSSYDEGPAELNYQPQRAARRERAAARDEIRRSRQLPRRTSGRGREARYGEGETSFSSGSEGWYEAEEPVARPIRGFSAREEDNGYESSERPRRRYLSRFRYEDEEQEEGYEEVPEEEFEEYRGRGIGLAGRIAILTAAILVLVIGVSVFVARGRRGKQEEPVQAEVASTVAATEQQTADVWELTEEASPVWNGDPEPAPEPEEELQTLYLTPSAEKDIFFAGYETRDTERTAQIVDEEVQSSYAVLIDVETGEVVAGREADVVTSPASMTKILTLLVAVEHLTDLDRTVTMTQAIGDQVFRNDMSAVGYQVGDVIPVRDLLYGTILPSGADAAMLLAEHVAGSQEAFVAMMNEKVEALGLSDTAHFSNPVGVYEEENHCTMKDMAMILKAAVENDLCREVLSAHIYTTSPTEAHPEGIEISNWFLRRIEDKDAHGEVVCAKTGFVDQSGCCAASYQISNDGGHYICVTGNAWSSWRAIYDHVRIYDLYTK